jgi:putative glycosyltransferase (TIGR04348 family)
VHRNNKDSIVIVTPAPAAMDGGATSGNHQTAQRWARMLSPAYRVQVQPRWAGPADGDAALLIALHARRSAPSVAAWRAAFAQRPLLLVLTGTDLYRDIVADAQAQHSLALADTLVVLNEWGARALPAALRDRCRVILQSCPARQPVPQKTGRHLRALMVGHLRDEKDPRTAFEAVRRLAGRGDILFDHIGGPLDPVLAAEASTLARTHGSYRWLGALPHAETRRRIQAAHVLVHPSRMEGGAHVVIEAMRSGTPVLVSRIDGNLGIVGAGYPGIFEPGDAAGLARLLVSARDDAAMLPRLQRALEPRVPLFEPTAESAALHRLIATLLSSGRPDERPRKTP